MIRFRSEVRIRYCTPQLCHVLALVTAWSAVERIEVEIFSIDEARARNTPHTMHGFGLAIDLDTADEAGREVGQLADFLRRALEPQYEVLREGALVHVEYDTRRGSLRGLVET